MQANISFEASSRALLRTSVLMSAFVAGCAGTQAVHTVNAYPPAQPLQALAVAPVTLTFGGAELEAPVRTQELLQHLWKGSAWRVVTPHEFRILDPRRPDLLRATDLAVRSKQWQIDPYRLGYLRTRISQRETWVEKGAGVSQGYKSEGVVELTLTDRTGKPLVEVRRAIPLDPFENRDSKGLRGWIRQALAESVARLIEVCPRCLEPAPVASFEVRENPAALLEHHAQEGRTLREHLVQMSDRERDRMLLQSMRYFDADMTLERARNWVAQDPGFCVGADAPQPLRKGDCVTALNGDPVASPHTLRRILAAGSAVELTVQAAGGSERIVRFAAKP